MAMPTPLPITDRPIRIGVVGLGQIGELVLPPYVDRDDVAIVALCDANAERITRWSPEFPDAHTTTALDELLGLDLDVVDVLVVLITALDSSQQGRPLDVPRS